MKKILSLYLFIISITLLAQTEEQQVTTRFKSSISYLTSNELQGRLTGSVGEKKSSEFIAEMFKQYGLNPMGDSNSYFQNFSIIRARIANRKKIFQSFTNKGLITVLNGSTGEFYPLAYSCNKDSIWLPSVYVNYGINCKEHNDYADTNNLRGKIFVIQLGSPSYGKKDNLYEAYESISYKVNEAIKHGARGVVFIRLDTLTEIPKTFISQSIQPSSIPVVYTTKDANRIMEAAIISLDVDIMQLNNTAHNVIGYIKGRKKNKTIIIGAHQDHLGYNELGGSRTSDEGKMHVGADDNASGVAMIIELAKKISNTRKLRKYNYIFIAFSGEEQGLLGSNYFVKNTNYPLENIRYMLNYDMVGRLDSTRKTLLISGTGTSSIWNKAINKTKLDTSNIIIKTEESGVGNSDHTTFYYQKIPALHFFTGQHADYHLPSDVEAKINYKGMYWVYNTSVQLLAKTRKPKNIDFKETKNNHTATNFKVTMGVMPDYIYTGGGMRIDGVTQNKPAHKAGILKGDIIVQMGDFIISNINDYMLALSKFNKGETVSVKIKRGTLDIKLDVTF